MDAYRIRELIEFADRLSRDYSLPNADIAAFRDTAAALRELMQRSQPPVVRQPEVPPGWKLVPVEPTREILLAEDFSLPPPGAEDDWAAFGKASWAAMLDASPSPPAPVIDDAVAAIGSGQKPDEAQGVADDRIESILHTLNEWSRAYPEDIFREPSEDELAWLHTTKTGLLDRVSASMGRHMVRLIRDDLRSLTAALTEARNVR